MPWSKYIAGLLRQRGPAVCAAATGEVERIETKWRGRVPVAQTGQPVLTEPAVVEPLEGRVHLSFNCYMSAQVANRTVSAVLWTTGGQASQYVVHWNDPNPNGSTSITYTAPADGSPKTVTYVYQGPYTGTITTVATSTTNATSTAYYALSKSFGNFQGVQGTGASSYIPNGSTGIAGQTSMAIDNAEDHYQGEMFVAHSFYPSGGGGPLFGITAFAAPGQAGAGQFDSTFGNIQNPSTGTWAANNGTYVVPSFGGGSDIPYGIAIHFDGQHGVAYVVGKCARGWAIVAVDLDEQPPGQGVNNGKPDWGLPGGTTTFKSGQANGVWAGDNLEVVGTSGAHIVAAALSYANGSMAPNWGDNGTGFVSVPYQNPGGVSDYSATAYSAFEEDDVFSTRSEEMLVGGSTSWCCGPCGSTLGSDYTIVEINDDTGTYDGAIRTNVATTLTGTSAHLNCNPSSDSIYSLVPWQPSGQGQPMEVDAVGQTNAFTGGDYFTIAQYRLDTGALVSSFGQYGRGIKQGPAGDAYSAAVVDSSAGTFVVTGQSGSDILTAKFTSSGALDSTFGNSGVMYQDYGDMSSNSTDIGYGVLVAADGSILVCGTTLPHGSTNRAIALLDYLVSNQVTIA